MAEQNKSKLVTEAPNVILFNQAGLVPSHAYYSMSTQEFQSIVLDFVRKFVPSAQGVTWMYDGDKAKSKERGCTRLFVYFAKNSPDVTGRFPDNAVVFGEDCQHSDRLKQFLNTYADTSRNELGAIGEMQPRRQDEYRNRAERVLGYELDPSKILRNIFDCKGVGYARLTGEDNPTPTSIEFGEILDPRTDKVTGMYVRKFAPGMKRNDGDPNGLFGPKRARNL